MVRRGQAGLALNISVGLLPSLVKCSSTGALLDTFVVVVVVIIFHSEKELILVRDPAVDLSSL